MTVAQQARRRVAHRQFGSIAQECVDRGEMMHYEEVAERITKAIESDATLREMGEDRVDFPEALVLAVETLRDGTAAVRVALERRERERQDGR